jgi:hypothetical protein
MSQPHLPADAPIARLILPVPDLAALPADWTRARRSPTSVKGGSTIDTAFRDSRECPVPAAWIDTSVAIYEHAQEYLRRWHADRTARPVNASVLRYTGGGHLGLHNDLSYHPSRRLTTVLYLNDTYEGGEIEFPKQSLRLKPRPGELLIFPAGPGHPHQVHEVTSGHRLCLQSFWMTS